MTALASFANRLSRQIQLGKGIRLNPEELDLLVTSGAFETLSKAAATEMREVASQRLLSRGLAIETTRG